jgi:transcriptional regulator with XRE-family HTH domain
MTIEHAGPPRASSAMRLLEEIAGEPLTFGGLLRATREGEGESQEAFARRLGVSKSHLSDVENARKVVSAARAARWAEVLGYSPRQFVQLALQDELREAGLPFRVELSAA